eukprot:scaffold1314_cov386-Pavlova_lutheri.AAC.30
MGRLPGTGEFRREREHATSGHLPKPARQEVEGLQESMCRPVLRQREAQRAGDDQHRYGSTRSGPPHGGQENDWNQHVVLLFACQGPCVQQGLQLRCFCLVLCHGGPPIVVADGEEGCQQRLGVVSFPCRIE